jgi:hypothetical protein
MTKLPLLWRVLLLGTWGICLALTLLPALPALYFQQGGLRSLVHTAAWLLAFPATGYWVAQSASKWVRGLLRWVPRLQWALVGLLLLVPGYGWLALFYFFLAPSTASHPAPSLLRRGQCSVGRDSRAGATGWPLFRMGYASATRPRTGLDLDPAGPARTRPARPKQRPT